MALPGLAERTETALTFAARFGAMESAMRQVGKSSGEEQ